MDVNAEKLLFWKCLRRILFNQKWIMMRLEVKSDEPEKTTSKLVDDCDKIIGDLLREENEKAL